MHGCGRQPEGEGFRLGTVPLEAMEEPMGWTVGPEWGSGGREEGTPGTEGGRDWAEPNKEIWVKSWEKNRRKARQTHYLNPGKCQQLRALFYLFKLLRYCPQMLIHSSSCDVQARDVFRPLDE